MVMDEPTNHLDLPSIECLETTLAMVPCAMLLVSHDEYFLKRLARTRWRLIERGDTVELKVENWSMNVVFKELKSIADERQREVLMCFFKTGKEQYGEGDRFPDVTLRS